MRRLVTAAAVLLALTACSSGDRDEVPVDEPDAAMSPSAPSEVTPEPVVSVTAAIGVSGANALVGDGMCSAWGDYTAFNDEDLQGVIADATGATVGVGDFGPPRELNDGCVRTFEIEVPAGGEFYTLSVGDWTSRTLPEADLATTNLTVVVDG